VKEMKKNPTLYKATLKQLILQGMIRLLEDNVELLVKKGEENLVDGMIADLETEFSALMKRETKRDYTTKLTVIKDKFMSEE
jgi:V-type H+-transporting ATPase subunit E